jgi:YidC/Oxa1 family membrane protein insertase
MKANYVFFVVFSLLILFGWNTLVVKRLPPPAAPPARASAPAEASTGIPPAPSEERPVEKVIGRHRIVFNAADGGVLQWRIEDGPGVSLVLPDPDGEHPLAAFPGLVFQDASTDEEPAFEADRPDGLAVRQSYRVAPDGFLHAVTIALENTGDSPVNASFELGWGAGIESGVDSSGRGAKSMAEERALALEGPRLDALKPGTVEGPFRWFAVDARYFMAAFINDGGAPISLRVVKKEKLFSVARVERVTLAPGEKREFTQRFYLGPKGYDSLAGLGLDLERAVNFGWFPTLGRGIHRALLSLRRITGNFGWAIICLTFAVQLLLSPLTVHSFKHTQKMKTVQPQLKRIQEMYKSDPRRLNSEMMALYKRHGLRFMGMEGCLPVFLQMPVFFALYSVLSKTYELRRSPWIGWIRDLSVHDPIFALPILMGGAMFLQQRMTLSSTDPTQKQMMYIMPVMFTFIFLKMPSGLVIYWLTQSLLTWAFQVYLLKRSPSTPEVAR